MRLLLPLLLVGCGSSWLAEDLDGDGWTAAEGDCFDNPESSRSGIAAADIHPGESNETWYDGVDQNCDGADDYDKDADGHASADFDGDDCWDDPTDQPAAYTALSGFYQPLAKEVHPGGEETWYDGVDEDCGGTSDFDQDGDGFDSKYHVRADGTSGDDCFDAAADAFENPAGLAPENVNTSEVETWYDGTNGDCVGTSDYDQDGDGFDRDDECDDLDAEVYPNEGLETWYDGLDQNCDGWSDFDQDGDGYDSADYGGDDCNDDPALQLAGRDGVLLDADEINPGTTDEPYDEIDADCAGDSDFDADGDGQDSADVADEVGFFGTDCDDDDGSVYAGASETWYDGVDSDCSGGSDFDQDGDGADSDDYAFGSADDCDDGSAVVFPGRDEDCSTLADDDCSGSDNDEDSTGCLSYYLDNDSDGYGKLSDNGCYCEPSGGYSVTGVSAANDDCNDAKSTVNPGVANEDCDTSDDDDCDGTTNVENGDNCDTFYADADGDGYGTTDGACWCSSSGEYTASLSTDCDDAASAVHPGATELCDLSDNDCDGSTDEGTTHYYTDVDGDGYGDDSTETCTSGGGRVTVTDDCDDGDDRVYPGADELCDEQQNDCSAASWSATDEEGTVSYATTADVWSDVTSAWFAGTAAIPVTIPTASTGSYYVCPGTWYVTLSAVGGDDVEVIGPYGATDTILSRNDVSGAVVSISDSDVYLEGLTLTGGRGSATGGFTYGGGMLVYRSTATGPGSATLVDCEVTDNTATYGGGIASYGYGDVTFTNTDIYANAASGNGGGVFGQKGAVVCSSSGVYSNTSTAEGGGLYFTSNSFGTFAATTCDFTGNSPDDAAGAAAGFATKSDATYGASATFTCTASAGCTP
ncbi:hypothetical protein LBMAG42_35780 [Deltaproteobacteria bacterium]|nr:hypothetical protein LBMAG42_35780 [Deltaproteobacteria bacterium]